VTGFRIFFDPSGPSPALEDPLERVIFTVAVLGKVPILLAHADESAPLAIDELDAVLDLPATDLCRRLDGQTRIPPAASPPRGVRTRSAAGFKDASLLQSFAEAPWKVLLSK
jgi:hypothetical protein